MGKHFIVFVLKYWGQKAFSNTKLLYVLKDLAGRRYLEQKGLNKTLLCAVIGRLDTFVFVYLCICICICICICVFVFVFVYLYLYLIMTTFCFGSFLMKIHS